MDSEYWYLMAFKINILKDVYEIEFEINPEKDIEEVIEYFQLDDFFIRHERGKYYLYTTEMYINQLKYHFINEIKGGYDA